MTDPTTLPDVVSVGQRRRPGGVFPTAGGGGGGNTGDSPGRTIDLDPGDPEPPQQTDPCAHPDTALPWNADAAGAYAVQKFLEKAAEIGFADAPNGVPNLRNREFGSFLIRGPGASITLTPTTVGEAGDPTSLELDPHNTTPSNYQGDVHSHPFGNPLPSQDDWNTFMANNDLARRAGRSNETFYMYIIAADQNGGPPITYVYQDGPRPVGSPDPAKPTQPGPEVNPDAQPCP